MKKIFYLASCDTCKKILNEINNLSDFELREIKQPPISEQELEELYSFSQSYEKLFSKRAQLYKQWDLKNKNLTENDFKKYILEHYTFLARPVIIFNNQLFIGNSKKVVEQMLATVNQ